MSDLPAGRHLVAIVWVFEVKDNADGSLERHESRIVANSSFPMEGLNYDETFVPVMRYDSLHIMIDLATSLFLITDQHHVMSAFLNGDLVAEIWMIPTPDMDNDVKILGT